MELRRSERVTRGQHRSRLNSRGQPPCIRRYTKASSTKGVVKNIASKPAVVKKKVNPIKPDDNLLKAPLGVDFDGMCDMDKILHNVQHGAPLESTSLPYTWVIVSKLLVKEGFFTEDQYNAWGAVTALKRRYQGIRCVIQGEHAHLEPKDKTAQRLYWAEEMDVLDLVGSKTTYLHERIPQYMQGIEEFTQNVLDQKRKEFLESAVIELDLEPSRTNPTVAESVVPDTRGTTQNLLEVRVLPLTQQELGNEIEDTSQHSEDLSMVEGEYLGKGDTPLHSEDLSMAEGEHSGQGAMADNLSSEITSKVSTATENGPSPAPKGIHSSEKSEREARSVDTMLAFIRKSQSPSVPNTDASTERQANATDREFDSPASTKKVQRTRRFNNSKTSDKEFIIHEDPSGSTPDVPEDPQIGRLDHEDPKENMTEEEDNTGAAEFAETDVVFNSQTTALGRLSNSHRAISPNRGREILGTPSPPGNEHDPELPPYNPSRSEISLRTARRAKTPDTSSTFTS
ncbi:hypothetical protein MMC11_005734 [Xylographa trunciseda]|nr:hypothetical protein [Xylographa trunciseda]